MKNRPFRWFIALVPIVSCLCCTSCISSSRLYSWYDYENTSYQYQKSSDEKLYNRMLEEYSKIINDQRGSRQTIPPGLLAEYGYMLYKSGKTDEGLTYMKKEIELYPESRKYISRIIKQLEK